METKQGRCNMLEKLDNWILTSLGGLVLLITGFFTFFFKNFFDRLTKAETNITELQTKTQDFRIAMKEKMIDQQKQNTREHDQIVTAMNAGLESVGKSIDVIRDDQKELMKAILNRVEHSRKDDKV